MKKYVIILLVLIPFFALSCKAQSQDFMEYLSNFRDIELPFQMIDGNTKGAIFHPDGRGNEIDNDLVKKFVYNDSANEFVLSYEYIFYYGVKYKLNDKYVVLLKKYRDLGIPPYDFDLSEKILVVYSPTGKLLSSQAISKDSERWLSYVHFLTKDKITVQQIKILGVEYKSEMECEIEMLEYKIDSNGIITKTQTTPIKKGVVIWDEEIDDFKLKTDS